MNTLSELTERYGHRAAVDGPDSTRRPRTHLPDLARRGDTVLVSGHPISELAVSADPTAVALVAGTVPLQRRDAG